MDWIPGSSEEYGERCSRAHSTSRYCQIILGPDKHASLDAVDDVSCVSAILDGSSCRLEASRMRAEFPGIDLRCQLVEELVESRIKKLPIDTVAV